MIAAPVLRAALLLGALLALPAAGAAEPGRAAATAPLVVDPARQGYQFDDPAVLVRQIVFGLAHGVTLLARACLDTGDELRRPVQAAYEEWLMRYGERIIDSEQLLAAHYFGPRAAEAGEEDIARALNLPPKIDLRPASPRLREACETFPQALARKRYNLDLVYSTHRDEQRLGRALEWRATAASCRQSLEPSRLAAFDAAFAAWLKENEAVEQSARARWLRFVGDDAALAALEREVAATVSRRVLSGRLDVDAYCLQWAAGLAAPSARLSRLMGDGAGDLPPAGAGDAPPAAGAAGASPASEGSAEGER